MTTVRQIGIINVSFRGVDSVFGFQCALSKLHPISILVFYYLWRSTSYRCRQFLLKSYSQNGIIIMNIIYIIGTINYLQL